jgi:hypothetical protein
LSAERVTAGAAGKEIYQGVMAPSGAILIVGNGSYENGITWVSEFSGQKSKTGQTVLKGSLTNQTGASGSRFCSLVF